MNTKFGKQIGIVVLSFAVIIGAFPASKKKTQGEIRTPSEDEIKQWLQKTVGELRSFDPPPDAFLDRVQHEIIEGHRPEVGKTSAGVPWHQAKVTSPHHAGPGASRAGRQKRQVVDPEDEEKPPAGGEEPVEEAPPAGMDGGGVVGAYLKKTIQDKIIDGRPARYDAWPWTVALDTVEYGFICGAVLIDIQWVLTAAHCVYKAPVTIYADIGAYNLSVEDQKDRVPVLDIIVHPNFPPFQNSQYDIALLKLVRQANVNSSTDVIQLPSILFNLFELNPYCVIIGWGKTDPDSSQISPVMNQKWVNVITNTECQTRWNQAFTHPNIYATQICIDEGIEGTTSTCQGDSGSPLHCFNVDQKQWILAGISSWGSSACSTYPSVYMRVNKFLVWIYNTMGMSLSR